MNNAGIDNWKRDYDFACIHDCESCKKQTRVEFKSDSSFNLIGIHCTCGHYTKVPPRNQEASNAAT